MNNYIAKGHNVNGACFTILVIAYSRDQALGKARALMDFVDSLS